MMKNAFIVIGALAAIPLVMALAFSVGLYYAWAFSTVWNVLVAPVVGLTLTVPAAYGIATIAGLCLVGRKTKADDDEMNGGKLAALIIEIVLAPICAVLFACLVSSLLQ